MKRALILIAMTAGSLGIVAGPAAAQTATERFQTIRVTGQARVEAPADQADIDVGVVTRGDTSQKASADNARQLDAVLTQLRRTFGSAVSIRSVAYSIRPEYGANSNGSQPRITGYTASNTVRATLTDLTKIGEVIDAATAAGANQLERVRFSLKKEDDLRARALREAAINARARADALAAGLGVRVVRVVSASEENIGSIRPSAEAATFARGAAAITPIEAGPIEMNATVTLTMEIRTEP